jgi:hypothetical protein
MRTSFELKFTATDYESAKTTAANYISRFLGIEASEAEDRVDIELKVETKDDKFEVTAFGKFKNGVSVTSLNPISGANRIL